MTNPISTTSLGSEFDDFLFAPIGEDKKGMLVSVLSGLARLNKDPWEEAEKLAQLPVDTATPRLISLISSMSDTLSDKLDPGKIAARLAKLPPKRGVSNIRTLETIAQANAGTGSKDMTAVIALNVLFLLFVLGTQFLVASRMPVPQVDGSNLPTSSLDSSKAPSPTAGQ